MLVIKPTFGFIIFVKLSISPFLSIPTSKTPNSSLCFKLSKLNGTPNLLLYDFGEILTLEIFPNTLPNNSLRVVFPQLPVIAIIFVSIFCLNIFEISVINFNVFLTFI